MSDRAQDGAERLAVPERRVVAAHRHRVGPEAPRDVDVGDDEEAEDQADHQEQPDPGEQDGAEHVGVVDRVEPQPVGPDAGEDGAEEQQHRQRDERRHQHPAPTVHATRLGSGRGREGPKMSLTWLLVAGRVAGES